MTDLVEPQATPPPATTPWVPMWSLNPTGVDLRYQGDYAPGSYTDGDIVVFQGVAYLCVRPTGAAPVPWSPPQISPTYGTTLPANPVDGQEHVLVDSVTAPTWQWRFRYNAGNTSAHKWEFVGGAPWYTYYDDGPGTVIGNAWTFMTAPRLTLPRAGVYMIQAGIRMAATPAANNTVHLAGGVDADGVGIESSFAAGGAPTNFPLAPPAVRRTVVAGAVAGCWAHGGAQTGTFYGRSLTVAPVRVS